MKMKSHHAAALALVVWYLLHPPLPHLNPHASRVDPAAPLARWTIVKTFPTRKECDAHKSELCAELNGDRSQAPLRIDSAAKLAAPA